MNELYNIMQIYSSTIDDQKSYREKLQKLVEKKATLREQAKEIYLETDLERLEERVRSIAQSLQVEHENLNRDSIAIYRAPKELWQEAADISDELAIGTTWANDVYLGLAKRSLVVPTKTDYYHLPLCVSTNEKLRIELQVSTVATIGIGALQYFYPENPPIGAYIGIGLMMTAHYSISISKNPLLKIGNVLHARLNEYKKFKEEVIS